MTFLGETAPSATEFIPKWLHLAFLLAGGVVGWFGARVKSCYEMKKLRAEIANLGAQNAKLQQEAITEAGKTLKEIQASTKDYIAACVKMREATDAFYEAVKRTNPAVDEINRAREMYCAILGEQVIPSFHFVAQWNHLAKKSDAGLLQVFVQAQLLPELERFCHWADQINAENLLQFLGAEPLVFSQGTLLPFLDCLDGLSTADRAFFGPKVKWCSSRLGNPKLQRPGDANTTH